MSPARCACPQCARVLRVPSGEELPAKVQCPRCATKFLVNADGTAVPVPHQAPSLAFAAAPPEPQVFIQPTPPAPVPVALAAGPLVLAPPPAETGRVNVFRLVT